MLFTQPGEILSLELARVIRHEAIDANDFVTVPDEFFRNMRPDETGGTSHQTTHTTVFYPVNCVPSLCNG